MPAPFVRLGRVVRVSGRSGALAVAFDPRIAPEDLAGLDVWVVPPLPSGVRHFRIGSVAPSRRGAVVGLEGLGDPDEARAAVGRFLLAREQDVPDLAANADSLVGYDVLDRGRGRLGSVTEVIVTGANDVLVVEGGPFGQVLVPVIDDVIEGVDHTRQTVRVALLEGLIEEAP